jgi:hypothetical protein
MVHHPKAAAFIEALGRWSALKALLAVCFSLFMVLPAAAAEEAFSVRVPVDNQQADVREQAMVKALSQALVRATGRDDIAQSPAVAAILQRPDRFLQRYQYEAQAGQQLVLLLQFDGPALRRALAEHGVPSWGADRPAVLVWLAAEQGGRRLLVGGEEGAALRAQLQEAAAKRGLLLLFPLMDAEDQRQVSYTDVFGGFTERVRQAAGRYGTPIMVMGRLYRDGNGWVARWTLSGMGETTWSTTGASQQEALDAAAAVLARRLGERYALLPPTGAGADQRLVLRVVDVDDLRDYDRLERRLRDIGGVASVRPLTIEPDAVVLQLGLQTLPERVLGSLQNDRMLVPIRPLDQTGEGQGFQEPVFRLTP